MSPSSPVHSRNTKQKNMRKTDWYAGGRIKLCNMSSLPHPWEYCSEKKVRNIVPVGMWPPFCHLQTAILLPPPHLPPPAAAQDQTDTTFPLFLFHHRKEILGQKSGTGNWLKLSPSYSPIHSTLSRVNWSWVYSRLSPPLLGSQATSLHF